MISVRADLTKKCRLYTNTAVLLHYYCASHEVGIDNFIIGRTEHIKFSGVPVGPPDM